MNFATVVVTYNRKMTLIENIEAQLRQKIIPNMIYIIDNHSSDNTKQLLQEKGYLDLNNISYIYLDENIGGAGGFYLGTKLAYESNFDFICLMDDDGRPKDPLTFYHLLGFAEKIYKHEPKIMLNSLVYGEDDILSFGLPNNIDEKNDAINIATEGVIVDQINPFNGTLISRELISSIGFPNKDFFIKGDEEDYTRRARKANAYIATVVASNYYHPILKKEYKYIFSKRLVITTEAPWKEYYRARNYTYIFKSEKNYRRMFKGIIIQMLRILLGSDRRILTLFMVLRGFKDGLLGRLGSTVKP